MAFRAACLGMFWRCTTGKVYRKSADLSRPLRCAGELRTRRPSLERAHVQAELSELAIEEIVAQRACDGAKGEIVPRNRVLLEELNFEAFRSRAEAQIQQARPEHHVDLVDVREADDGV